MIILVSDDIDIAANKLKGNSPVTAYRNRPGAFS